MKVIIKPYLRCNTIRHLITKSNMSDETIDRISEWKFVKWVDDFLISIYNIRTRKIKIKIDPYDTWNMDHTLSLIIVPMLKQMKETKHGYPDVDKEDAPDQLLKEDRWNYVLDEMIFAHESVLNQWEDTDFDEIKEKRVQRGLELFGKYYRSLWD